MKGNSKKLWKCKEFVVFLKMTEKIENFCVEKLGKKRKKLKKKWEKVFEFKKIFTSCTLAFEKTVSSCKFQQ